MVRPPAPGLRRLLRRRDERDRVCFLHLGPHKTGTTAIQQALHNDARRLFNRGFYYPPVVDLVSGRRRNNHTPLARPSNFRHDDLMDTHYWSELDRQLRLVDGAVVISSEHFAEILKVDDRYDAVVDFFHDRDFRLVFVAYVRDQPAWLNSWYTQDQRNFMSRRSLAEFRDHAIGAGLLDPWSFLARPMNDPRVEVRVVSFEKAARTGMARSFYDVIGVPPRIAPTEARQVNPNLGAKGLYAAQEIMRRVDGRVRSMPNYVHLYESFKILLSERDWEGHAYVGVTEADIDVLRRRYAESNDLFAHRWFGCEWVEACPPRSLSPSVFDFDAASEADRRDVLEVVERMVELIAGDPAIAKAFMEEHRAMKARKLARIERAGARAGRFAAMPRFIWPGRRAEP